MEMPHIIYMQEASGQPHIDHYRSKLYSLYTSIFYIVEYLEWGEFPEHFKL